MPSVWCYNEECKCLKDNECMADMIELDEYGACGTFENYKDDKEYKAEYFIAVNTKDKGTGEPQREERKLQLTELNFYRLSATRGRKRYIHYARSNRVSLRHR